MIDQLPANMQTKISIELAPLAGFDFCWAWTGCLNSRGYGCVAVNGKSQLAHRRAYELLVGPIAAGLQIDHLCRNKCCCNPDHLEPVDPKTNMARTDRSEKTLCINGHRLVGDNLIVKQAGASRIRNCRECTNARKRIAA